MAEGTYEFECNRAELLGTAPPSYEDWQEAEKVRREKEQAEEMTELDRRDENLTQNSGKMDEINNILSITQMRLNKFKKACGSLTNLLKIRGGADADESQPADSEGASNVANTDTKPSVDSDDQNCIDGATSSNEQLKKVSTDMQQKMSGQIDKLDLLLTKAENAQYSMANQNKQMKSYLKK